MVKKQTQPSDLEVYKMFLNRGTKKVEELAKKIGVSRFSIYKICRRVEEGRDFKLREEVKRIHSDYLWERKYKVMFDALPKDERQKETVSVLRSIIRNMSEDGFSIAQIAEYTQKHRTTIIHHLQ